jgi:hypothetical protein
MDFLIATPLTYEKLKSVMGMLSASFKIEIAAVYVSSRQKEANTLNMPFAFDIPLADVDILKMASFFLDSRSSKTKTFVVCSLLKRKRDYIYVFNLSDTYISLLTQEWRGIAHVFCVQLAKSRKGATMFPLSHQKTSNLMFLCQRFQLCNKNSTMEALYCLLLPALKLAPPPPMFLFSGNASGYVSACQNRKRNQDVFCSLLFQ